MRDFRRQKRIESHTKPGLNGMGIENRDGTEPIVELEHTLNLPCERWSMDPFDCFPISMQRYMQELLHLCKSRALFFLFSCGYVSSDIPIQDFADL